MPRPVPATPARAVTSRKRPLAVVAVEDVGLTEEVRRACRSRPRRSRVAGERGLRPGRRRSSWRRTGRGRRRRRSRANAAPRLQSGQPTPASAVTSVKRPAVVPPEGVATVAGDVHVGVAVAVVVGHGDALAVPLGVRPTCGRDVLEPASPTFSQQHVGRRARGLADRAAGTPWAKKRSRSPSPSKSSRPTPPPVVSTGQAAPGLAPFVAERQLLGAEDQGGGFLGPGRRRSQGDGRSRLGRHPAAGTITMPMNAIVVAWQARRNPSTFTNFSTAPGPIRPLPLHHPIPHRALYHRAADFGNGWRVRLGPRHRAALPCRPRDGRRSMRLVRESCAGRPRLSIDCSAMITDVHPEVPAEPSLEKAGRSRSMGLDRSRLPLRCHWRSGVRGSGGPAVRRSSGPLGPGTRGAYGARRAGRRPPTWRRARLKEAADDITAAQAARPGVGATGPRRLGPDTLRSPRPCLPDRPRISTSLGSPSRVRATGRRASRSGSKDCGPNRGTPRPLPR